MSDPSPVIQTLAGLARSRDLRVDSAQLARAMAAIMADPQTRAAEARPVSMARRMAEVTAVNAGPPFTADVILDGVEIIGVSPQFTYRPQVGDPVWLEMQGADVQISSPVNSDYIWKWNPLTLASGWFDFAAWAMPASYWRDPMGMVHLRGSVASGANSTNIAVLPEGYRPPYDYAGFSVYCVDTANPPVGRNVAIGADGGILYLGPSGPVQVALDSISFRVD